MKTSEMSPLLETIEVSEDVIAGGTLITNNISDISGTPSDNRNGIQEFQTNFYSVIIHKPR